MARTNQAIVIQNRRFEVLGVLQLSVTSIFVLEILDKSHCLHRAYTAVRAVEALPTHLLSRRTATKMTSKSRQS